MTRAILFVTFNRIETTKVVFEQIRIAQPPRLYFASDGPRSDREKEISVVQSVRQYVLDHIDWKCEVKTRFNDENMGCGKGESSAITWFFSHEKDGIVLEDDTVPDPSFFGYCEQMLDRYRDDKRIWSIGGDNPLGSINIGQPYFFTKIPLCWGWATWADRWALYEFDMADYDPKYINNISSNRYVKRYWMNILNAMKNYEIDTWDYQWLFTINKHNGLTIIPSNNMMTNIGVDGVHYQNAGGDPRLNQKMSRYDLSAPVPTEVKLNKKMARRINIEAYHVLTLKKILKYMYIHPMFLFKRKFWNMV